MRNIVERVEANSIAYISVAYGKLRNLQGNSLIFRNAIDISSMVSQSVTKFTTFRIANDYTTSMDMLVM